MFALVPLVAWALAFGSMTHFNVFAQNSTCATNYTVQQGDQCAAIASKFNITNADLHAANPVINTNCTNLAIGEVLCVPAAPVCTGQFYQVQSGDNCIELANKFNMTSAQLETANPEIDANCDNLSVGQSLCIPKVSNGTSS